MVNDNRFCIIGGVCVLENEFDPLIIASTMADICDEYDLEYIFKGSFDKANRTSADSFRGIGMEKSADVFHTINNNMGILTTTDFHTPSQVSYMKSYINVAQIPAFLCRQTDLIQAAASNYNHITIKKGQFMSPSSILHSVKKANKHKNKVYIIERGTSFGYNQLIVDYVGFERMSLFSDGLIMDITHCCQTPNSGKVTAGINQQGLYCRCAMATGHIRGVFMEVHIDPPNAKSDASTQLRLSDVKEFIANNIIKYIKD